MSINELIAEKKYEAAAEMLYNGLLYMFNTVVPNVGLTKEEFELVAPKLVEKLQDPTKKPVEPTPEPGDDVVIVKPTATLEISFNGPKNIELPPTIKKEIRIGGDYEYYPMTLDGYKPQPEKVSGKMVKDGVKVTVTYIEDEEEPEEDKVTLTITYVGPDDGTFVAPAAYTKELGKGEEYIVVSPTVEGYTPDKADVNGAAVDEDINVTVTYTKNEEPTPEKVLLTINYEGPADDTEFVAPDSYIEEFDKNSAYEVESPEIEGYTPDKAVVSGTITEDTELTVTYSKAAAD